MENATYEAPATGQQDSAPAPESTPPQEVSAEFKRPDDTEGGTCD